MSDSDIFTESESKPQETPATSSDPLADRLAAIKNENGEQKYKDVVTALEALAASQQFIETLKSEKHQVDTELQELRDKVSQMESVEDVLKRIAPNAATPKTPATPEGDKVQSEQDIMATVEKALAIRKAKETEEANLSLVVDSLSSKYGDQAGAMIKQRALDLGTTPDALKDMARNNPKVVLELMGVSAKPKQIVNPSVTELVPPHKLSADNPLPKWEKGIARGGLTNKEIVERMKQAREYTNKRLGLDS